MNRLYVDGFEEATGSDYLLLSILLPPEFQREGPVVGRPGERQQWFRCPLPMYDLRIFLYVVRWRWKMVGPHETVEVVRQWIMSASPEVVRSVLALRYLTADERAPVGEAGALFAFCGWLTSRNPVTTMSSYHECSVIVELVSRFCLSQGWEINDATYPSALRPFPRDPTPEDPEECP